MSSARVLISAAGIALLASCSSLLEVHPGSYNVRVVDASMVSRCDLVGETTSSVLDRVWFIDRDPAKVDEELLQLARNSAVDMKGDSIVPGRRTRAGEQRFSVYKCLR